MTKVELENRIAELEASFELRWKADMRAIERWHKAGGRATVWPDHADLCVWLLEQLDAEIKASAKWRKLYHEATPAG